MTRKKKAPLPKARHTWKIRPETRVEPSAKIYRRSKEKRKRPAWVNQVDWFGEERV